MKNFIFKLGARLDAALIWSIQKYELNAGSGYGCAFAGSNGQRLVTAAALSDHSSRAEEQQ